VSRPALRPVDFACLLKDAPSGPFLYAGKLGFKTGLNRPNGTVLAYFDPGQEWTLGDDVVVQPVEAVWP
jgi:hypothetical protein